MGLQINQTSALIGIDRIPGSMEMRTQNARLEMTHKEAKVNIESELPKVIIDQYECFAECGLKNSRDLNEEINQRAYQQLMEYIGGTAEDGDMLAAIHNKGNAVAQIAQRKSIVEHEFGMVTMPTSRPRIEVTGSLSFNPEPNGQGIHNGVEGTYTPGKVDYNYTPTQIKISMRQYNSISFNYTGNNIDQSI